MINLMHSLLICIPLVAVLLGVFWIFNDRIAEIAEIQEDAQLCYKSECTAPRCTKRPLMYI